MSDRYVYRLLFALLILPLSGCASLQYSAEPIEAWVVDAETKRPLEGAIVVAHWELKGGLEGGNIQGQIMVMESVTDKAGRFYFPAWGPTWHIASPWWGYLSDSDPELLLFKSGYGYVSVSNSQYTRPSKYSDEGKPAGTESKPTGSQRRISFWNGETIKLRPFKMVLETYRKLAEPPPTISVLCQRRVELQRATLEECEAERLQEGERRAKAYPFPGTLEEEYANHLAFLKTNLSFAYNGENCEWKRVPRMLIAQHLEKKQFDKKGIFNTLQSIDDVAGQKRCGSAQEFFRDYLP